MTRLPLDDRNVVGHPGPRYLPPMRCARPFCDVRAEQGAPGLELHHIWRRSFLGGGFNWAKLPDGKVVGNVVYLCREHHREITENQASIQWNTLEFVWDTGASVRHALSPQPPLSLSEVEETPDIKIAVKSGGNLTVGGHEKFGVPMVKAPEPGETCQLCERRLPHPKKETSPATTVVKSWRLPAAEKEAREETIAATAEHLGISTKEKFWMDKLILHLCVIALQGPGRVE